MVLGRGRSPKSAATRRAEGVPGHRPVLEDVIAPAGAPPKPVGLSPEASAHWDRIVEDIAAVKVLAVTDGAALEQYITLWEEARLSRIDGERSSMVRCMNAAMSILDRFCLNPAARAKVKVDPGKETSERLKKFLAGGE